MTHADLSSFDRADHRTLRDHAYAQLRTALMTGQFAPGARMTIRGLAAAFGISATPIREAVSRLAAEGAIEAEPNRWMRVPFLSASDLREVRELRVRLEGLAAKQAAIVMTAEELAELRAAEDAIVALRPRQIAAEMIPAIGHFHFTIYRAARMPALLRIIEGLWLRTAPAVNLLFPEYTREEKGRLRRELLEALERRDPGGAEAAIQTDIGRALDYLISIAEHLQVDRPA